MRKILIVEDDRFITAIFTMFIKELNHELIGRCASGLEAIDICKQVKPDVVLMDIHLEGELDGIQTSARLQRDIGVPVIYVSSDTATDVIKRAVVSNSYGYLVKPINKQELGIAIDLAYYKYKVDQEQKQREQGYREFISDSPIPLILVKDNKIKYLNKAAIGIMKTHYIEDVMGQNIQNFIAEEDTDTVLDGIKDIVENNNSIGPIRVKLKTVHGDAFYCQLQGSKMMFNNQETVQLVLSVTPDNICRKREKALNVVIEDGNMFVFKLDANFKLSLVSSTLKKSILNGTSSELEDLLDSTDVFKASVLEKLSDVCDSFELTAMLKNKESIAFEAFPVMQSKGKFTEILFVQK